MTTDSDGRDDGRRAPRFSIDVDPDGLLEVRIRGVWEHADVHRFFETLIPVHADVRWRHGAVRALTMIERVQSPLVALYVRERALAIKRRGDRNAFVVASFLSRMQINRLASSDSFGLFTNRDAAIAWLRE